MRSKQINFNFFLFPFFLTHKVHACDYCEARIKNREEGEKEMKIDLKTLILMFNKFKLMFYHKSSLSVKREIFVCAINSRRN